MNIDFLFLEKQMSNTKYAKSLLFTLPFSIIVFHTHFLLPTFQSVVFFFLVIVIMHTYVDKNNVYSHFAFLEEHIQS